ncbi:Aspartic proteinase nepenthesin-1 [Hordeum vulgare]|nr:Aspartic proteinase nepenthesin-1 [Hordeum vulgare]
MDLLEVFLSQRFQLLQKRLHPMWMYEGSSDPSPVHSEGMAEKDMESKIMAITSARDDPRGARRMLPYKKYDPPIEIFQHIIWEVPNIDRAPRDVVSATEHPYEEESDDEDSEEKQDTE